MFGQDFVIMSGIMSSCFICVSMCSNFISYGCHRLVVAFPNHTHFIFLPIDAVTSSWEDPEGGGRGSGPPPSLKDHKNIGFF